MRILFVVNEIPYHPLNGIRIVSFNAIRLMLEKGHQVHVACLTHQDRDAHLNFIKLQSWLDNDQHLHLYLPNKSKVFTLIKSILSGIPFFMERYRYKPFQIQLKQLVQQLKPDAIHYDVITMSQYVDRQYQGVKVASINDSYGLTLENALESGNYKGLMYLFRSLQLAQTKRFERKVYCQFDAVHLMSKIDANYLAKLNPMINTCVIPNGVDQSLLENKIDGHHSNSIVFVAQLSGQNLDNLTRFIERCWPKLKCHPSKPKLTVVGTITDAAKALIKQTEKSNIHFVGFVAKIQDAYRGASLAVVPINKNCGIINKAIEPMAAGLVTIGFQRAFAGIAEAKNGEHYIGVNTWPEITLAIEQCLDSSELRKAIQQSAKRLMQTHYSWQSRGQHFEAMYSTHRIVKNTL